jgi:hypothetical protein
MKCQQEVYHLKNINLPGNIKDIAPKKTLTSIWTWLTMAAEAHDN